MGWSGDTPIRTRDSRLTISPFCHGLLGQLAKQLVDCIMSAELCKFQIMKTFYQIGLVGLKLAPYESASWVDELGRSVSFPEINNQTSAVVNPSYHRALGVTG